jgi:hypothetical protein
MQLRYGLLAELVAAPARGDALAAFLASARETAAREEGTVTRHAFNSAPRRTAHSTHLPAKMTGTRTWRAASR